MIDVKELRNQLGITQHELAEKCGVTLRTVQYWEKGKTIPESALILLRSLTSNEIISCQELSDVVLVPVVNLDARGGFGENVVIDTSENRLGVMPFSRSIAREGDLVIPVYGDSMSPKYPSGSMVLIRNVPMWREYIELGAAYVIELVDERRLIKNVQKGKSDDCLRLESINPDYQPSDIPKTMIRHIFRVLMSVRREAM